MICATDHSTRHGRFKPPSFESLWDSSDLLEAVVDACGGPALVARTVIAYRLAASRPSDSAARSALARARLAAVGPSKGVESDA